MDARDRLSSCTIPTLVVAGEDEPNLDDQRELATLLDAELILIADAGHLAPMERPEVFVEALTPFLQRHA
jgi:pimeloyl-ACP methyl ester carboxylesterase